MTLRELVNIIGFEVDEAAMKRAEAKTQNMFNNMKSWGAQMSLKVTAPIMGAATFAVKAFSDYNMALAIVQQRLTATGNATGRTVEEYDKLSVALSKGTFYEHDDVLKKVTGSLLMYGNISAKVFDRAQKDAIDVAAAMGEEGDLQQAAMLLGKALENPAEAMNSLGRVLKFKFTKAEEDAVKQMVAMNDVTGAQDYILTRLEKHGIAGAAAAMAKAGTGARLFWKDVKELAEGFGKILFPIWKRFFELASKLVNWVNDLDPSIKKLIILVGGFAAAIPVIATVIGTLGALLPVLLPAITAGFAGFAAALNPLVLLGAAAALGKVALALAAIMFIGLAIEDIIGYFQGKDSVIGELIEAFQYWFDRLVDAIPGWVDDIKFGLGGAIDYVIEKLQLWFGWVTKIKDVWDWVAKFVPFIPKPSFGAGAEPEAPAQPTTYADWQARQQGKAAAVGQPVPYSVWQAQHGLNTTPSAAAMAPAAGTRPNVNTNVVVHLAVPDGTPAQQRRSLQTQTEGLFDQFMNRQLRQTYVNYVEVAP